jgi:tetratricopeptide (TPR) repeat protein
MNMKFFPTRNPKFFLAVAGLAFTVVAASSAQGSPSRQGPPPAQSGAQGKSAPAQGGQPETPKLNPKEEADYKAFMAAPPSDAGKKIQLGEQFLQTYPGSRYEESVDNQLVNAYYSKQDWKSFYSTADKVVEKDPDDVDVLAVVGWVIPHLYNPEEPGAETKLNKAESYEKHAIEILESLQKPANLTDDQFTQAKAEKLTEAHSGLGLVYFRMQDFDNAVKELQLATSNDSSPDPTDFYVLGVSLQQLKRNPEAANAFTKCAQIPGGLQDRCRQSADQAKNAK